MNMKLLPLLMLAVLSCFGQSVAQNIPTAASPTAVLEAVAPRYPDFASLMRIAGTVTVKVIIDSQGKVIGAKSTGQANLALSAEKAARQWLFEPVSSKVEERMVDLIFEFSLPDKNTPQDGPKIRFAPPYRVKIVDEGVCLEQNKSVTPRKG